MTDIHHYGSEFNETAAVEIVPFIMELIKPSSLIDVGAGICTWASVFKRAGVRVIKCLDGGHVPPNLIRVSPDEFESVNLASPDGILIPFRYDLCLSLEVAEHLPETSAAGFVSLLCRCSDVVVFSAAIPGQTGENHINEQFPQYWVSLFERNGYRVFDPFRRAFWNNSKVEWWYRQNMLLALAPSAEKVIPNLLPYDGNLYVHPELFGMYVNRSFSSFASACASPSAAPQRSMRVLVERGLGKLWRLFFN